MICFIRLRNVIILNVLLTTSHLALGQTDCVLKKDIDSIQVYTCRSEQLNFKTIKSKFTIDVSLSELVDFLLDIDNYSHWQYNTLEAHVLKKTSDRQLLYYAKIEAPWPVSDRDMVVDLRISQDSLTRIVTITCDGEPQYVAENEHLVRVPMSKAVWTIVPLSSTRLRVEYHILIDPGGSVPAWMINMVAAQAPYESFRNLKQNIQIKNAQRAKATFIKN